MVSAVRIVDTVTLETPPSPEAPSGPVIVLPGQVRLTLLLVLKSGSAPGTYEIQLVLRQPRHTPYSFPPHTAELSPQPYGGANVVFPLSLALGDPGLYHFDVLIDGRFVTSVPLQVVVQKSEQPK